MLLHGSLIVNKPKTGITIALWIYMDATDGQQEIFQTIDAKAPVNKHGMFYLEVSDGQVRWFHRNEEGEVSYKLRPNHSKKLCGWRLRIYLHSLFCLDHLQCRNEESSHTKRSLDPLRSNL